MILINRFVRIYSYFPHIFLMFMFRLLLYGEQHQQHHVDATKISANAGVGAGIGTNAVPSTSSSPLPSTDQIHQNSDHLVRNHNTKAKSNASERKANIAGGGGNVGEIFIAVIYPKSKEATFSRAIKQTVTSLSEDFTLATSLRVVPHYTAIADTDGYNVQEVQEVCNAWNHKPIIAAVVFSTFKSGFGHVLTSLHNNIPVLWATGEIQAGYFERVPLSRFDVRLDPGSYEVLRSLRSLLLATHWHAFTVMHTTTLLASQVYRDIINRPPLLPTILQFRPDSTSYYIFRLLSDVSKSTKGVIVLICEGIDAKRVIEESKKLNMVNGDFVWLWIDTSAVLIKDKTIRLEKVSKEINFVVETRKVRHAATAASVTIPEPLAAESSAIKGGATVDNKTNSATSTTAVFSHYNKTTNDRRPSNNPVTVDAYASVPHQNKTDTNKPLSYKYLNTRNDLVDVVVVDRNRNSNDKITTISGTNRTQTKTKNKDNDTGRESSSHTRWPKTNKSGKVVAMAEGGSLYREDAVTGNEARDHGRGYSDYYHRGENILANSKVNGGNDDEYDTSLMNNEIPSIASVVSSSSSSRDRETASTRTASAAAVASFNTLMKHHFSLYRKKNRRITNKTAVANITTAAAVASSATTAITAATAATLSTISDRNSNLGRINTKHKRKNITEFSSTEANDGHVHDRRNDRDQWYNDRHRAFEQDGYSYSPKEDQSCSFLASSSAADMSTTTAEAGTVVNQRKIKRNEKHSTKPSKFAFVEKISIRERSRKDYLRQQRRNSDSNNNRSSALYPMNEQPSQFARKPSLVLSAPAPSSSSSQLSTLASAPAKTVRSRRRYDFSSTSTALSLSEKSIENENENKEDFNVDIVKRKVSSQTQTQHVHDVSPSSSATPVGAAPVTTPYDFEMPIFSENNSTPPVSIKNKTVPEMPVGILSLQLIPSKVDKNYVRSALRLLINTLKDVIVRYGDTKLSKLLDLPRISCFDFSPIAHAPNSIMDELTQNLKRSVREAMAGRFRFNDTHLEESLNSSLAAKFKILNLVHDDSKPQENKTALESRKWRTIGHMVGEDTVHLETIVWPGGDIVPVSTGRGSRSIFRIVTAFAPPFVMIGESDEDGQCLRGIECHQFLTSDKDNLTLLFNEMERTEEEEEVNVLDRLQLEKRHMWGDMDIRERHPGHKFKTNCCYGLSMDLLENVAEELEFDFQLYVVADGFFGTKTISENGEQKWNGIMGDLVSGAAHLSFSALSVSSSRAQAIDFSAPYFFSGVSFLAAPKESTDIPLLAFLLPFSSNLWIAIFTSLHVTAAAVAIYEWLSPFGLNPWGRQRSKNFGVASALWVMWGLLCGHLVQFKAPKSWPNKFLINVWGGFSVIFIASYTANIAALIAGLFFHTTVGDHHDRSLLSQRVGAPKASAAEYYVKSSNQILWDHMQRYSVISVADGVQLLKNGSLDILIADTPILDYYRATDHGCKLQRIGDTINEDTYAIGMTKGFPLKDSISAVIAKYSSNGYMDILQEKWYGGLPCFKLATDMAQPRPLGVAAVAGVFLMLGCGVLVGCLILFSEHLFYKYTLPSLRKKPKSSMWKSRNVMFFSQKLYRFINCVELVSPHHAARELVHTLRQGQITSLFQKSVRRKEHEQRQQQQKSKAQFFEMIQEIRRVQQEERKDDGGGGKMATGKSSPRKKYYGNKNAQILLSPTGLMKHRSRLSPARLDFARRLSKDVFRSKSSGNLDVRRISSDINVAAGRFFDFYSAQAIGRRLSHGATDNSPPDMNARRASQFFKDDTFMEAITKPSLSPCGSAAPAAAADDLVVLGGGGSGSSRRFSSQRDTVIAFSPSDSNLVKSPKSPKSPTSAHSGSGRISSNSFFSRDIGPLAAKKFSNVEPTSSFRGIKNTANKPLNKMNAPKVTINNREISGYEEFDKGANDDENSDDDKNEDERYHQHHHHRHQHHGLIDDDSRTLNTAEGEIKSRVESPEHIIEIVIPSSSAATTTMTATSTTIDHRIETELQIGDASTNREHGETKPSLSSASVSVPYDYSSTNYSTSTTGVMSPKTPSSSSASHSLSEQRYDFKPKIILHLPPPKTKKTAKTRRSSSNEISTSTTTPQPTMPGTSSSRVLQQTTATAANSPLQRLSRDELISLLQLSEKDLKENLLIALGEKDAAA